MKTRILRAYNSKGHPGLYKLQVYGGLWPFAKWHTVYAFFKKVDGELKTQVVKECNLDTLPTKWNEGPEDYICEFSWSQVVMAKEVYYFKTEKVKTKKLYKWELLQETMTDRNNG